MSIDPEILLQAQQRDHAAFRKLVEHYQKMVFDIAFYLLSNEDTAKDIVQESFIRVWKNIHIFNPDKKFTTWLYKIVVNLCYDDIKSAYRKKRLSASEAEQVFQNMAGANQETEMCNRQLALVIEDLARELTFKQRMVFVLRDLQDFDLQEIADVLQINAGAVKSNLYYARLNIRKKLLLLDNIDEM